MKKDFSFIVYADNSFGILNRMINAFNRRRIRIRTLMASEDEQNPHPARRDSFSIPLKT